MLLSTYVEITEQLPSKIVIALDKLMIDADELQCSCGATITNRDEIESGQCFACDHDDDCPTCGDSMSCAACSM